MPFRSLYTRSLVCGLMTVFSLLAGTTVMARQRQEIPDIEIFALATDRDAVLKNLVPGSEEDFFLRSLHGQNNRQLEMVDGLLAQWKQQYGETEQWRSMTARQAILKYDAHPEFTTAFLKQEFSLRYDHQRRLPPAAQNLPSRLETSLIDRERLIQRDLQRNRDLSRLSDAALYQLGGLVNDLDVGQKRNLLRRITLPDFPGLTDLIVAEMRDRDSGGFGSIPVHFLLTTEQLRELSTRLPELAGNAQFVHHFVSHLYSGPVALPRYWETRIADLDRVIEYLRPLPATQNSLKAAALHERLRLASQQGQYDLGMFLEYLRLPRNVHYMHPRFLKALPTGPEQVNLSENFQAILLCAPPHDDAELVSDYLQHILRDAGAVSSFTDLIEQDYLNAQLATAQVLAGNGDASRWSTILGPARYRELVQRIDLEFNTVDQLWYQPAEAVSVSLRVKNVDEVVVRIFELNTLNCYRDNPNSISADLSVEGLVPNHERKIKRDQSPAIQSIETVELPELDHRGVYLVDFIGGGKNCRALIRKGRLTATTSLTVAGHEFTVLDESNTPVSPASVWVGGRKFDSGTDGKVFVPFSNSPGLQPVIVQHHDFADLATAEIARENWTMNVQMHVDREGLIPGADAQILVRPSLSVAGIAVPARGTLQNVNLVLTVTTIDGDSAIRNFRDLPVDEAGEIVIDFLVPPRLRSLALQLNGTVRVQSQSTDQELADSTGFAVNRIDGTAEIVCPHLILNRNQYVIELLGRNGEPRANWPVALRLNSVWSNDPVDVTLQTDDAGRLVLGELKGTVALTATVTGGSPVSWNLGGLEFQSLPSTMTVVAGEDFRLPVSASSTAAGQDLFQPTLFQIHQNIFREELPGKVMVEDGWMKIGGLESGDYVLKTPAGEQIRIWSIAGRQAGSHLVNDLMEATLPTAPAPTLAGITENEQQIRIQVAGATASTRVHVLATRYVPAFPAGSTLGGLRDAPPVRRFHRWDSNRYVSARKLGDEYLYILNRQSMERLAGNLLERPSLLLAPWSLGPTENQGEVLASDDAMKPGAAMDRAAGAEHAGDPRNQAGANARDDFANLEYLMDGTFVLDNMRPDKDGFVSVDIESLGDKHHLTVVLVDLFSTTVRTHARAVKPLESQDRRLVETLPVDQHLSLEKRIEVQPGEKAFVVDDILTSRFESVDDLGDAWKLLAATCDDSELPKFEFIVRWNQLKVDEKRKLYEEHACHELNYFLYRKDPGFFGDVILPLIRNRHWTTFMDQYLLEMDLAEWTSPWRFSKLNTFERILLAQRLAGQRPGILRHIDELTAILPPDDLLMDGLFEAAVVGGSLNEDPARRELLERKFAADKAVRSAAPPSPAPQPGAAAPESEAMGRGGGATRFRRGGRDSAEQMKQLAADLDDATGNAPQGDIEGKKAELRRGIRLGQISGDEAEQAVELLMQLESDGESAEMGKDAFFSKRGRLDNRNLEGFYQSIKPTERWVEYNYWRIRQIESTADRIGVNRFWRQFAGHNAAEGFLSPDFIQAHRNLSDVILALAVLDLPEQAEEPKVEFVEREMRWLAPHDAVVFHQQLRPLPTAPGATRVMVSENFFDAADRYQTVDNRRMDKFVSSQFFTNKLYGSQVVVTNPTSTPQSVSLLVQIPQGAIAVSGSRETRTIQLELPAFGSASHEYWFYFPAAGEFVHYPAHAADDGLILAWANTVPFNVIDEQARADRESWEFVSQNGSDDELLAWMAAANLQQVNLADIAWRMKEPGFFDRATELLSSRFIYNPVLWSYSVLHQNTVRIGEYLANEQNFVNRCGPALESTLLTIEPGMRGWYEHVEFSPLINARAHQTGASRKILNSELLQQYSSLLGILAAQASLSDDDRMAIVYYLLVQDRVSEAIEWFGQIDASRVAGKLQYDYAAAWLAISRADPDQAATIAGRYTSYPVARWRNRFQAVADLVLEAGGKGAAIVDPDSALQQQTAQAETMPSLNVETSSEGLVIDYRNLQSVQIDYHQMDVELLFSRDPFNSGSRSGHSLVRPNLSESVDLPAGQTRLVHPIPESVRRTNVIAEVRGGDQQVSQTVYSNNLDVQMVPAMGQLQVRTRSDGTVLAATYVKVFAETSSGEVIFFKDGYTDIRGRFDYVTQSNVPLDNVIRLGVLVKSDQHGCMIRQSGPPQR